MACLEDLLVHQDLESCRLPAFVDSALRERCGVSPWSSDESHPFGWLWQKNVLASREWHQRAASLVTAFNQSPEAFGKYVQYKKAGQFLRVFGIKNGTLVWLGMPWKTCKDSGFLRKTYRLLGGSWRKSLTNSFHRCRCLRKCAGWRWTIPPRQVHWCQVEQLRETVPSGVGRMNVGQRWGTCASRLPPTYPTTVLDFCQGDGAFGHRHRQTMRWMMRAIRPVGTRWALCVLQDAP